MCTCLPLESLLFLVFIFSNHLAYIIQKERSRGKWMTGQREEGEEYEKENENKLPRARVEYIVCSFTIPV